MSLTRDVDSEKTERTYTTKHGTKATMKTGNIGRNKPAQKHNQTMLVVTPEWVV